LKKVVIDTNALISFVTDRNPEQQEIIAGIFEAASISRLVILCHQQVLREFVYVLEKVYGLPKEEIQGMMRELNAMPGVQIVHELDMKTLFTLWPATFTDYGDAVLASFCKSRKDVALLSFDAGFIKSARNSGVKLHTI
jgi:predicted nucleic acid-binding protein